MSKPEHDEREQDDLDLDVEKVQDLEVDDENGDKVRGGGGATHHGCLTGPLPISL